LFNIILPMFLINELTEAQQIENLLLFGGLIVLNNVGFTFLTNTFQRFMKVKKQLASDGMMKLMSEKIMNLEYSYLEDPTYLDLKERAVFTVQNQSVIENVVATLSEILSNGVTLIGLIAILVTLGPVLIIVLVIGIVLLLLIYASVSKVQTNVMQEMVPINRRMTYYLNLATGKEYQKDIRCILATWNTLFPSV